MALYSNACASFDKDIPRNNSFFENQALMRRWKIDCRAFHAGLFHNTEKMKRE